MTCYNLLKIIKVPKNITHYFCACALPSKWAIVGEQTLCMLGIFWITSFMLMLSSVNIANWKDSSFKCNFGNPAFRTKKLDFSTICNSMPYHTTIEWKGTYHFKLLIMYDSQEIFHFALLLCQMHVFSRRHFILCIWDNFIGCVPIYFVRFLFQWLKHSTRCIDRNCRNRLAYKKGGFQPTKMPWSLQYRQLCACVCCYITLLSIN